MANIDDLEAQITALRAELAEERRRNLRLPAGKWARRGVLAAGLFLALAMVAGTLASLAGARWVRQTRTLAHQGREHSYGAYVWSKGVFDDLLKRCPAPAVRSEIVL